MWIVEVQDQQLYMRRNEYSLVVFNGLYLNHNLSAVLQNCMQVLNYFSSIIKTLRVGNEFQALSFQILFGVFSNYVGAQCF